MDSYQSDNQTEIRSLIGPRDQHKLCLVRKGGEGVAQEEEVEIRL